MEISQTGKGEARKFQFQDGSIKWKDYPCKSA